MPRRARSAPKSCRAGGALPWRGFTSKRVLADTLQLRAAAAASIGTSIEHGERAAAAVAQGR